MMEGIFKWLRKVYNKFVHSIAFMPALFGFIFLLIAVAAMELDAAGVGFQLNEQIKWLNLNDASTARSIVSTVSAGIISLTVFSFSMVMILMNQAASQMSNRMLDSIIGDKVQKIILSFYIGTIIFSLFLLINISETDSAVNIPSLSIYFLLVLTISDIFLFVYFLHHITQSFRYEQLIQRIHNQAINALKQLNQHKNVQAVTNTPVNEHEIPSFQSGYFQGFNEERLLKLTTSYNIVIRFLHPVGSYILKDTPFLAIKGHIDDHQLQKLFSNIDFYYGQEIDKNAYYGFFHLTEIAVKALSPGINDPGTAVLSINALTDLFSTVMKNPIEAALKDNAGNVRVFTRQFSIKELFERAVLPIWDYGKKDRIVQHAFVRMLEQLIYIDKENVYRAFFEAKLGEVQSQIT